MKKNDTKIIYPTPPTSDTVDNYHGTLVPDPFRPLEDPENPQTLDWTVRQHEITSVYLHNHPAYEKVKTRLTELWNHTKVENVWASGDRYFYQQNDGLLNQPQLLMKSGEDSDPQLILDPNQWSADGTIALMDLFFSKDQRYLAYTRAESGSDWNSVHIRDLDTGTDLAEVLVYTKFPSIAWHPESNGFFYNSGEHLDQPDEGPRNPHGRIYWHTLHTGIDTDELIYENPADPELRFAPIISDCNEYLLIYEIRGGDRKNGMLLRDIDGGEIRRIFDTGLERFEYVGSSEGRLLFHTFMDAPMGRLISLDPGRPEQENWIEILPDVKDALIAADVIGDTIVTVYSHDAYHVIRTFDLTGAPVAEVELPAMGTVTPCKPASGSSEYIYIFTSFLHPPTVYIYDIETQNNRVFFKPKIDFDFDAYHTEQHFYTSKDGTQVPLFTAHRKNLERNGDNPTILYGYGGFNLSQNPFFNVWNLAWLEMGGVFALANLRGGSEFGEPWHQAGMLENKQNVFDDFISAGEWMIDNDYTQSSRLAIEGRSNGGLLVSAVMVQRPDLFGSVLCHVPVTDMLRYHRFTVGHFWVPEYGNAETDPEHFEFLYRYSPLHNVDPQTDYPPILVTTADTDDRVVPSHSKKFVAALQTRANRKNPVRLRVEAKAGHKFGRPTYKSIEERADIWTFAVDCLDIQVDS